MQAIFLSNDPAQLRRVYSDAVIERLEQSARCAQPVFTWADVLAAPETFRDVRAVFSSWGMPAATEEELARCLPKLQYVFYAAGTVQRFARPFFQRGVRIFHAAAANGIPVAEYAASAILLANKGFFQALRRGEALFSGARPFPMRRRGALTIKREPKRPGFGSSVRGR